MFVDHFVSVERERSVPWKKRALKRDVHVGGKLSNIKLCDITGSCPEYLTLSHCWGTGELGIPEDIKTKTDTLQERKTRITVARFPQTFRDAIEITLHLGFRYLWIDALCIIQDSPEDWATESRKMGYIYSHAVLNIDASGSSNSHGGCFNSSSCSQDRINAWRSNKIVRLLGSLKDSTKSVLLLWLNGDDRRERFSVGNYRPGYNSNIPGLLEHSAVLELGWIFQERMLSKRVVHFTKHQVLWECHES
jgi:Heterokaryon incompatibility protein (HET)